MEIWRKQRTIESILSDEHSSDKLKHKLKLVRELCDFAETQFGFDVGKSYSSYADLHREHVVWNVFAAPELSFEPKQWSYPFVGKLDYRGYFAEEEAEQYASELRAAGYDVFVGKVDAYSTLGWFNDPVLNTFVYDSDVDVAELIFHELTHRHFFIKGDTDFNEALATAVSHHAVLKWLESNNNRVQLRRYRSRLKRRMKINAHIENTRRVLQEVYDSNSPSEKKRELKKIHIATLQSRLRDLFRSWGGKAPESWLNELPNNARLNATSTYYKKVPKFSRMIQQHDGNINSFFEDLDRRKQSGLLHTGEQISL